MPIKNIKNICLLELTIGGAAATNATLAFFGGGSLAAGGLGMAGGTAVLGGLVAGPALLVMGIITGANAGKGLEEAKAHAAEADVICEQLETGVLQCTAIRRMAYIFHNLLARLDAYFLPLIHSMEDIVKYADKVLVMNRGRLFCFEASEGTDYSLYSAESRKIIAASAAAAVSIKAVLDTPILTADGALTDESGRVTLHLSQQLDEE